MSEELEKRLAGIKCTCGFSALSHIQKMTDNDIKELFHFYDDEDYEPVFSQDEDDMDENLAEEIAIRTGDGVGLVMGIYRSPK